MPTVKLQSSDGVHIPVDVEVIKCSGTIKTMLNVLGVEEGVEEIIPLPQINSTILKKVLEYATHHNDDPPTVEEEEDTKHRSTEGISSWDAEFVKVDKSILFELIKTANFLDIKGLLDVACKTLAIMILGKGPEEVRKMLDMQPNHSPEELEQIAKENEWCSEK